MRCLGFHHAAIEVEDVEAVGAFYREVLALDEVARHRFDDGRLRSIWLALGGADPCGFLAIEVAQRSRPVPERDALGPAPSESSGRPFFMLALRIAPEARAGVLEDLARRGVAIERQTPFTVYFRDPAGTLVGLSHHPFPSPVV